MRNGDVSFWWHDRGGFPPRRPSLPGPAEADVAIVGAGYTGLWTAWYLTRAEPGLRVIVLDAAFAGFGASGRNGGWLTAALPGSRDRYAAGPRGRAGVLDMQRQLQQTVDEVAAFCAAEGIDAHLVKGGSLSVAFSAAQHQRLRAALQRDRDWGLAEADVRYLGPRELGDEAHVYMYAQRTSGGRIAIGGRGVPYRFGSGTDHRGVTQPGAASSLGRTLRNLLPQVRDARIEHGWCGVLGVPRDWCATVSLDAATGLGWAGGYTGHGVAAANLAGRTLADLVLGRDTPRTALPWVGHRARRWEPEPARWLGVRGLYSSYRLADRLENGESGHTSLLARAADAIAGPP